MLLSRLPSPPLRPFVRKLWATRTPESPEARRERVLPTGRMHLVFRLTAAPLRLFSGVDDPTGRTVGHSLVGGARAEAYLRDVSGPAHSVGAELLPGAATLLFGAPADALAGRHTTLDALWGDAAVSEARERLLALEGSPERQLDLFEALLRARLPRVRGLHPAIAHALARFADEAEVGAVVEESGYSHRRFIALFQREVGLTPKLHCRVLRFQRALDRCEARPEEAWAEVALAAGYSDQPHLVREFREFSGLSPGEYRQLSPVLARHVPLHPRR